MSVARLRRPRRCDCPRKKFITRAPIKTLYITETQMAQAPSYPLSCFSEEPNPMGVGATLAGSGSALPTYDASPACASGVDISLDC